MQYYNDFTMRKIGNLLGNDIKVDKLTLAQSRQQSGRICVEVGLQKPLLLYVEFGDNVFGVVYEGISMICFNCECFGHVKANCSCQKNDTPATTDASMGNVGVDVTPNEKSDASLWPWKLVLLYLLSILINDLLMVMVLGCSWLIRVKNEFLCKMVLLKVKPIPVLGSLC